MRPLVATLALLLLVPAALPLANAQSSTVTVTLRFNAGADSSASFSCAIPVAAGASGLTVLRTAFDIHCISQYSVRATGGGNRLYCLQNICDSAAGRWWQYENAAPAEERLEAFSAQDGDILGFSHSPADVGPSSVDTLVETAEPFVEAVTRFVPPPNPGPVWLKDTDGDGFPNEILVWRFCPDSTRCGANPSAWYAEYTRQYNISQGGSSRSDLLAGINQLNNVPGVDPLPLRIPGVVTNVQPGPDANSDGVPDSIIITKADVVVTNMDGTRHEENETTEVVPIPPSV